MEVMEVSKIYPIIFLITIATVFLFITNAYSQKEPEKQKTPEDILNPSKKGQGFKGYQEDVSIFTNPNSTAQERLDAWLRLDASEYNNTTDEYPSSFLPMGDLEKLAKDLEYETQDQLRNDFNSRNIPVKFQLAKKLYETGTKSNNPEYFNLALTQFDWLAGQGGSMSNHMIYSVARNLFNLYLFYSKQNDAEKQIASLKSYLKLIPGDPKTIRLLKELGVQ